MGGSPNVTQVSTPRSVSPVDMVTNKNEKLKQNKLQKLVSDKLAKVNTEEAATPNTKRKRIIKMSDSEDSSVSTDSPLKPKTYHNLIGQHPTGSPKGSPKSSTKTTKRQSKKRLKSEREDKEVKPLDTNQTDLIKQEDQDEAAKDSPVEELPLFPRSYHAQKKELDDNKDKEVKKVLEDIKAKEQAEEKKKLDAEIEVKKEMDRKQEI